MDAFKRIEYFRRHKLTVQGFYTCLRSFPISSEFTDLAKIHPLPTDRFVAMTDIVTLKKTLPVLRFSY